MPNNIKRGKATSNVLTLLLSRGKGKLFNHPALLRERSGYSIHYAGRGVTIFGKGAQTR